MNAGRGRHETLRGLWSEAVRFDRRNKQISPPSAKRCALAKGRCAPLRLPASHAAAGAVDTRRSRPVNPRTGALMAERSTVVADACQWDSKSGQKWDLKI